MILLNCFFFLLLLDSVELVLGFGTFLESTDLFSEFLVLVEVGPESSGQVGKVSLIFFPNFSQGHGSGILLVDQLSKSSFSLNKAVWDIHFSAEGWQPDNKFDGINIAGNDHKLGLFLFNQLGDVIETKFEVEGSGLLDGFF